MKILYVEIENKKKIKKDMFWIRQNINFLT